MLSKSPCVAPLLFVKEKDKPLRGVLDYRASNRIAERNTLASSISNVRHVKG